MPPFNVCMIRFPRGIDRFLAHREIAETVTYGLRRLGYQATLAENHIVSHHINIIFGFQVLSKDMQFPESTVFYNLEQIPIGPQCFKGILYPIKNSHVLWDYNFRNVECFRQFGARKAVHVPIGYTPEMTRIPTVAEEDIDVLFYGEVTDGRKRVLQALEQAGLRVHVLHETYGAERDSFIARAKVVLNMHKMQTRIFEVVRVSYLLANRKAVVSECAFDTQIEPDFMKALTLVPREKLVDTCVELVRNTEERKRVQQSGFAAMTAQDECAYLQQALRESFPEMLQ